MSGASLTSPLTATLTDPGTVDDGVKCLLDHVYLDEDTTAPYSWPITAAPGTHELEARWDVGGDRQEIEATFSVGARTRPQPQPFSQPESFSFAVCDGAAGRHRIWSSAR
jgi:hypothetical protein